MGDGTSAADCCRNLMPVSFYGRTALLVAFVEAVLVVSLESYIASVFLPYYSVLDATPAKGIPVYLMIFLFSQIFQVILCWDAVFRQNTIQLIGFVVFCACSFIYSIFQYIQVTENLSSSYPMLKELPTSPDELRPYIITVIVITGLCTVIFAFLAYKLYQEFGWKIYKKIGADPKMRNMYRSYQIFLMMIKLDFFFFVAFSVQFLVLVLNPNDFEFALTILAIPVTIVVLFMAVYGLRRENRVIMGMFLFGCLLAMAYFIFKLVRIYTPDQQYKYMFSSRFLTFFAGLSLLAVSLTFVNAIVCYRNFGQGLKQHISSSVTHKDPETSGDVKMAQVVG